MKRDVDTEVGMIIASTRVSNFKYLMSKMFSNFLVLLSITGIVFLMSIAIFFFRSDNYPFEVQSFLLPYLFVTIPSLFFVSSLAVVAEVFLGNRSVIQYIIFFALFNAVVANALIKNGTEFTTWTDPFGVKVVTMGLENYVRQLGGEVNRTTLGINIGHAKQLTLFEFPGIEWPVSFLLSRLAWMSFGLGLTFISSLFFHRFEIPEKVRSSKKVNPTKVIDQYGAAKTISLSALPAIGVDYGISSFIKTELLMLFRKGPRWAWLVNLGGMIALTFAPLNVAHEILLPILWFLQVGRFSDLTTKEKANRIHHFTFAAYQPLKRLLPSQLIAGIILLLALSAPLLIRYTLALEALPIVGILLGGVFIILLSGGLGIATGGKKLFEILFFILTYSNLNRIPIVNYYGFEASMQSIAIVLILSIALVAVNFLGRKHELQHS